jgi:Na+-translocating ferredoxin:NAD+ oxidoreductase subunit D
MAKFITVSPSPHIHSRSSVEKLMYGVIIALLPTLAVSVFYYGMGAVVVTLVSVVSCILFEFLIQMFILKTEVRITDGSALVTGLLLAFNLPSDLPVWMIVLGALVAIGVGKMTFGGLGNNLFNPALVGRVFLLISFPAAMTTYPVPNGLATHYQNPGIDGFTGPTPLSVLKEALRKGTPVSKIMDELPSYFDMFMGKLGGSMGEIAAIALILGLIYMLARKIVTWHTPISVIGSAFIFGGILWMFSLEGAATMHGSLGWNFPIISSTLEDGTVKYFHMADPVFHMLTGGMMLGAIFMATDYVTSPMTKKGMIIFGIGIGIITMIIRVFGAYPEGMSFAILIMNAFVPLINRYIKPKRFGEEVNHGR